LSFLPDLQDDSSALQLSLGERKTPPTYIGNIALDGIDLVTRTLPIRMSANAQRYGQIKQVFLHLVDVLGLERPSLATGYTPDLILMAALSQPQAILAKCVELYYTVGQKQGAKIWPQLLASMHKKVPRGAAAVPDADQEPTPAKRVYRKRKQGAETDQTDRADSSRPSIQNRDEFFDTLQNGQDPYASDDFFANTDNTTEY
jgi:hypothetical protein